MNRVFGHKDWDKIRKEIYKKVKTMDAKLLQLEITINQRDILVSALSFYDQDDEHELDDRTFDDLRTQLDNAQFLGESA